MHASDDEVFTFSEESENDANFVDISGLEESNKRRETEDILQDIHVCATNNAHVEGESSNRGQSFFVNFIIFVNQFVFF